MAKYVYPAILVPEETGGYCVSFPDVQGCYAEGKDLAEALENAQDALCLMLYDIETGTVQSQVSPPSTTSALNTPKDGFVNLITCDTNYYKRYFANKTVNKTVSIPAQLNHEAEEAGLNFSQILRAALEKQLQFTNETARNAVDELNTD